MGCIVVTNSQFRLNTAQNHWYWQGKHVCLLRDPFPQKNGWFFGEKIPKGGWPKPPTPCPFFGKIYRKFFFEVHDQNFWFYLQWIFLEQKWPLRVSLIIHPFLWGQGSLIIVINVMIFIKIFRMRPGVERSVSILQICNRDSGKELIPKWLLVIIIM